MRTLANDGSVKIGTDIDESGFKSGLSKLGSAAKAGLGATVKAVGAVATAAGGAAAGLLALESATEEYRIAQGKLNTAFEVAGYSSETAKKAYNDFYKILGDTDTAAEASQLLAKLSQNERDMSTWTNIAAGVWGTFGDALPIEGLIEAANETAKVGRVTGTLADALNWAGISEDEFNKKLESLSTESERNQLIMDTLASTYNEAADAFYRNNEAIIQARENQALLDESLSKVGIAVADVKSALIEQFAPVLIEVAEQVAEFVSGLDVDAIAKSVSGLVDAFITLAPAITATTAAVVAYKAASSIVGILDALKGATTAQTIAQAALNAVMSANPFVIIVTAIAAVVTALLTLTVLNEDFRNVVKAVFSEVAEIIGDVVGAIVKFFTETIPDAINTMVDWFKALPKCLISIGKDLVAGLWEGISGAAGWLLDQIARFCEDVVDGIKDFFGIHSPSDETEWMGEMLDEGLVCGIKKGAGKIKDAIKALDIKKELESVIPSIEQKVSLATSTMAPAAVYEAVAQPHPTGTSGKEEKQQNGKTSNQVTLVFEGSMAQLARVMRPYMVEEDGRVGKVLVNEG